MEPIVILGLTLIALLGVFVYIIKKCSQQEPKGTKANHSSRSAMPASEAKGETFHSVETQSDLHPLYKGPDGHAAELQDLAQKAREEAIQKHLEQKVTAERSFFDILESIPSFSIVIAGTRAPKRNVTEVSEISFSNITKRTPRDKLGNFVAIDVETTGLSAASAEIIEIAAIRFVDYQPEEKFVTFTLPRKSIPGEITAVNGITDDMVKSAPPFSCIVESLQDFIGKSNIVGHNLQFDLKFIVKGGFELSRCQRKYYDTLLIAQKTLKKPRQKWDREFEYYDIDYNSDYDVDDYKLPTLCAYYSIPYFGQHRALTDCFVTGLLLKKLEADRR